MQPAKGFQMKKHQQMWSQLQNYGSVEDTSHNTGLFRGKFI